MEVVTPVQVRAEHPRAGLAAGGVVLREASVYQDIVKADAFSFQRFQQQVLGGPEGLFREGRRSQAVLVGGHDQLVTQVREGFESGDCPGHEFHFFQGVYLLVGGLFQERSVTVDEDGFFHNRKGRLAVCRFLRGCPR